MFPTVLFDGEPRTLSEVPLASVPSLLHGAGLFETVRVDDGVPCFLARHLRRLSASLAEVPKVAAPPAALLSAEALERSLLELGEAVPRSVALRIAVVDAHVLCTFRPLPAESDGAGISIADVVRSYVRGDAWPQRKTLSYLRNLDAMDRPVLFGNEADEVCEAPAANVFALVNGRLRTPPTSAPCLPGIARAVLLAAGSVGGLPTEEGTLGLDDLRTTDICFVTNALRRAVAVTRLFGRPVAGSLAVAAEARRTLARAAADERLP